jgi:type IX secretion system PorP/SprF family membrane protein
VKKRIIVFKYALLLSFSSILNFSSSIAQDFHLSQSDAFSQYLNPAMTGMFSGEFRANVHVRSQWANVIPNPFNTPHLKFLRSAPTYLRDLRGGGYILNYRAGSGHYNVVNLVFSLAKDMAFGGNKHHLAYGLQLGLINKSVNLEGLYFDSQYSNLNSGSFSNAALQESFAKTNVFLPEINAGLVYYFANVNSRLNPYIGFSAFHLTQPTETFFNVDNQLSRRYLIHGGTKINVSQKHQFNLHFLAQQQANVKEITGNILGTFFINPTSRIALLYGFSYRVLENTDASVIHLGLKYGDVTGRISYDINVSDLQTYSQGRGAFEFSLVYVRSKPIVTPPVRCPRI